MFAELGGRFATKLVVPNGRFGECGFLSGSPCGLRAIQINSPDGYSLIEIFALVYLHYNCKSRSCSEATLRLNVDEHVQLLGKRGMRNTSFSV